MEIITIRELLWILGALLIPVSLLITFVGIKLWVRARQQQYPRSTASIRFRSDPTAFCATYRRLYQREWIARSVLSIAGVLLSGSLIAIPVIESILPEALPLIGILVGGMCVLVPGYGILTAVSTRCPVCYTYLLRGGRNAFEIPSICAACGTDFSLCVPSEPHKE